MQQQPIINYIPQRQPFIMIDSLLQIDETSAQTIFLVTANNPLTEDGHFTEAGLMENIAQTAAAHAGYLASETREPVKVGYIGAIKNLEIFTLPQIGDQLITTIKIENQIFDVTVITGTVKCNGKILATCEMKIFITP